MEINNVDGHTKLAVRQTSDGSPSYGQVSELSAEKSFCTAFSGQEVLTASKVFYIIFH